MSRSCFAAAALASVLGLLVGTSGVQAGLLNGSPRTVAHSRHVPGTGHIHGNVVYSYGHPAYGDSSAVAHR